ncbi:hypothetical protein DICPUDRAFT_149562 [Dictyostelium purpureum]|uniref:BLOC-1-related complex subunit 6 C-terminal helix domain-containing protein n=1 Tax=Dictyostelium purpureum TaxID=5786 RepID=F0ZE32_DICPU|nr:uncharacterized protein DICPUDRAFT_149562 [Dictyostelium purpureum]EGC37815.1 hypothetical protein DICPUDRAFT_149562 [Dictyostelium purpureum]|eukprot:XP_003285660.1 hypothetical protein DICPUDRAFT_149562 [Dictyostelium purpureum]
MNNKNKKVLNVNNNDQYFGNSIPSSPIKIGKEKKGLGTITSKLFSNFKLDSSDDEEDYNNTSTTNLNTTITHLDNSAYDDSDNSYDSSEFIDHYKENFFQSVLQDIKEQKELEEKKKHTYTDNSEGNSFSSYSSFNSASYGNSIGTYESFKNILNIKDSSDTLQQDNSIDNNNNNNNNGNIVLVNQKNLLSNNNNNKNNKNNQTNINGSKRRRKKKENIIYTEKQYQLFLDKIKKDTENCGGEFAKLLLNVNTICDNIGKISSSNMENYASTINKATLEAVRVSETLKMLINSLELLNSDMFEMYKLNSQM